MESGLKLCVWLQTAVIMKNVGRARATFCFFYTLCYATFLLVIGSLIGGNP